MTQSITYGGVDIAGHIKLPDGITGMTSHADGTYGAGSALIDDGAGIFNLVSLQEFIHEEDACSQPRTFTGFLVQRRLSRGVQVPGSGRDHDLDIVDLNYLLHLQPLRGSTAKRPVETGDDRMAWLMASVALDGIVFDNGLIGSNTNLFDEADYTLQYADDVLQDLSVSSSAEVGRIFFVYRDSTSGEPSLFMDRPTVTSYTSTLSISNDLSDLSDTCFPPYMDAELQSSGEDIYCSVFFKYKTGTVFRHNDTTHATYFASKGYHRQGVFETTRVGSEDTAIRHADAWLANHSGDLDTITCQIQLPADKVNLIEAGMRVQCKFTHFPGYDPFGYLRVSSRTVGLEPVNDLYLVRLVLTNRTLTPTGTGSGSTGDFPHTNAGGHWWSGSFAVLGDHSGGPLDSAICDTDNPSPDFEPDTLYNYSVTIQTGCGITGTALNPALIIAPNGDATSATSAYVFGNPIPGIGDGSNVLTGSFTTGDISHYGGATQYMVGGVEDCDHSSTHSMQVTYWVDPDGWDASPQPPASGQWVYNELVAEGDGSTVSFTTQFPYAAGSLRVRVDGVPIINGLDETDPAAGTFSLDFAPLGAQGDAPAEQVVVDYQGV